MPMVNLVWSGPIQIIIATILIVRLLGPPSLIGVLVLAMLAPLNTLLVKVTVWLRGKHMPISDSTLVARTSSHARLDHVTFTLDHSLPVAHHPAWYDPACNHPAC